MELEITELTTGYIIPKKDNFRYYGIENYFSAYNNRTKERDPFGIIDSPNAIRIPKIDYELLEKLLKVPFTIKSIGHTPYKPLQRPMKMLNQPKDKIQAEVIDNIMDAFKTTNRAVISLPTGQGKTYVATNIISQLNVRTIIFVKSVVLREQWIKSIFTHSNNRSVIVADGSSTLVNMLDNGIDYDIIITTHRTMQKFIDLVGMKDLNRFLLRQGIGLKIYDEFDLEADSTFKIETHTSIYKTLYLSATDYKSPNCDKVFQAVYGHLPNYGKEYDLKPERRAIFVIYNSKPTRSEWGRCHRYGREGPEFDYHKYHAYITTHKSYLPGLEKIWNDIIKPSYENKEHYLKTVFFIGRKVTADQFRKDVAQLFGISTKSIAILNSDTPDKDRARMMKYKLIISTADSMGRGIDLKGLDIVVDLETRASKSKTTQVIGRVSRSGAIHPGTYISFVDTAFPTVLRNFNYKVDSGFYETQFTKMTKLELNDKK